MKDTMPISEQQYLSTTYRPDCDYVDGEVRERNLGEYEHSNLQTGLAVWLGNHERDWNIRVLIAQRIRVAPCRYRVADICVLDRNQPIEPVFTQPPLICIEVLSKDDNLREMQERVTDYSNLGVPNVWIVDPQSRRAYAGSVLEAQGTSIRIPLDGVFAELD